ncbi:hypothetical protein NFI96_022098 [Prochilodus magdalenae]|nr:hypothetical protein NFI96_022098 [Prochilodus magdalenae]
MQGQMFSMMSRGEVRFRSDTLSGISGLTVCMRVLCEKKDFEVQLRFRNTSDRVFYRGPLIFGVPSHCLDVNRDSVNFDVASMTPSFEQLWPWKNMCFTWESGTGMAQLWYDEKMSIRKGIARGQVLSGQAELTILGFEGQVSDLYVWDSPLSVRDLYLYLNLNSSFPSGSILDWNLIEYSTNGYVLSFKLSLSGDKSRLLTSTFYSSCVENPGILRSPSVPNVGPIFMMAWALICVCVLAVLVPAGQTTQWQDGSLQGQMFSVMSGGEVRFRSDSNTTLSNITGLTVCMRVLFEEDKYNLQLTFRNSTYGVSYTGPYSTGSYYYLYVSGESVRFNKFSMTPSRQQLWPWNNRCFTWESSTGMTQLWFDEKMSIRKGVARGQVFSGEVELSLSRFDGQVTDVYVWDSVVACGDLSNFLSYTYSVPPGSILDWGQIQYSTSGYAVLEPTSVTAMSES